MAAGTVEFFPPVLGHIVVGAGSINVTVQANAIPATALAINTALGAVTVPQYIMPFPPNSAYTFQHNYNGDAVTVSLSSNATGVITGTAAATPNAGTTANGSGVI
jgi:hypothetical protein